MAATLRIDTLKFARKLTDAGLEPRVAEAIVEGLAETDTSDLATKTDLQELRLGSRVDLAELKSELLRFMFIQAVAIVGLTVALVRFLP
jgi:hypothetical protein